MTVGSRLPSEAEPVPSGTPDADRHQTQVVLIPQEVPENDVSLSSGQASEETLRLSTVVDVLRRRRRLAITVFSVVLAMGALFSVGKRLLDPLYSGSFLLLVTDPLTISAGSATDESNLRELALKPSSTANIPNLIQVLRSPLLLQPIAAKTEVSVDQLDEGLTIGPATLNADGVLAVTLEWEDPRKGQEILDALSREYLAFSLRQRQEKLAEGLSFLADQAPTLVKQVVELQGQLARFRSRHDFLEPLKQGEAIQTQRRQLETRLGELKQREAQLLGSFAAVRAGKLSAPSTQGSGSEELANQLSDLEKQLAEAEASFLPEAPQVRSLRDRLNEVRSLLQRKELSAIEGSLASLRSEQREMERQAQELTSRFASNPGLVKQYDAIQQRLDVARQNLTSYISTREDFRLEEAQRTVPWRIISPPRFTDTPVKPNLGRSLLLTLVIGALAGGGAALLRDLFERRYHNSGEVEQDLGLPLLGDVPFFAAENEAGPQDQASLLHLATSLELLPKDRDRRLILMASSVAGEGKSLITARLGQSLADLGQHVLLVDCDLRDPSLHLLVGATMGRGFSDLLTDGLDDPGEAILPLRGNLHLLSAGFSAAEACKRLGSEPCRRILREIRSLSFYDVVLFDSPAAVSVADALLLGREVDGIVFVVGLEHVERSLPGQTIERFRGIGAELLGIVTNRPSA